MDKLTFLIPIAVFCISASPLMFYTLIKLKRQLSTLKLDYVRLLSQKKSSEVRTGQIAEQLVPFLDKFKYNPKNAHFIGMPIDYIVFNDDEVVFVEVKTGKSILSNKQKNIKSLVDSSKVRFETITIS